MTKKTLPHGSWPSPISAERLAAGARPLAEPRVDGDDIYWLEGRAAEGGRMALMRWRQGAEPELHSPLPFNLRSRVHEYGGGAYAVDAGTVVFCHHDDQRVWRQDPGVAPEPITAGAPQRHADLQFDRRRARLIAVQENHAAAGAEPRNSLVAIALDGRPAPLELHGGHDFYAAPRLSPDGRQLAWLCWNHPDMPWCSTELWCAAFDSAGQLQHARRLAGGRGEALCQPRWAPDGRLFVVSDRSDWWNLYRVDLDGADRLSPVCPMAEECGAPMWVFGQSHWIFTQPGEVALAAIGDGRSRLHLAESAAPDSPDAAAAAVRTLDLPWTEMRDLQAAPGGLVMLAGSATEALQLLHLDLTSGATRVLARSSDDTPDAAGLSRPVALRFASGEAQDSERLAHAFFYPPAHAEYEGPAGDKPPLLVISHGGPTTLSTETLRAGVQYWTSRGIAVLDVNYGGSSGFGRPYRRLLDGRWGLVDVQDCVAGARHLVAQGLVDPARMAIRGGSASGFTTLCALAFHEVFGAGASYFGVADLATLDADTHKFEAHYTEQLICPPEQRARVYAERSPLRHAGRIRRPVIFFQGLEDRVVPPQQTRAMVSALQAAAVPVACIEFEGEGHGFRRAETLRRTLEAELAFYGEVFGFSTADALAAVPWVEGAVPAPRTDVPS